MMLVMRCGVVRALPVNVLSFATHLHSPTSTSTSSHDRHYDDIDGHPTLPLPYPIVRFCVESRCAQEIIDAGMPLPSLTQNPFHLYR